MAIAIVIATEFLAAIAIVGQGRPTVMDWAIAWAMGLLTQLGLLVAPFRHSKKIFALIALVLCIPWCLFLAFIAIEASISPNHLLGSTVLIACAVWGALIHGAVTVLALQSIRQPRLAHPPKAA